MYFIKSPIRTLVPNAIITKFVEGKQCRLFNSNFSDGVLRFESTMIRISKGI